MNVNEFLIAQFGVRLGTRAEGQIAQKVLAAEFDRLPDDGQVIVSLEGLEVLSTSFADEVIGRTLEALVAGLLGDRTMILRAPSPELADAVDVKLDRRKLAMLCLFDDCWELLGTHTPAMRETLDVIIAAGATTTRRIAEVLDIGLNASVNRVASLDRLRLIRRVEIGMNGPHPLFEIHSILKG